MFVNILNIKMWNGDQVSNIVNKCADVIEFGNSFGNYSRLKKTQFAVIVDEKKNKEGAFYIIKSKKKEEKKFVARIFRFRPEGMLLAMWKTGKISFVTDSKDQKTHIVDIKPI
mmetsp:Transcript_10203/g.19971  ORF Transcript_10203/g.19971 Transcript_10203/m.19971 type:complete len:113 (-) Transcript_10203:2111-2449(-)